MCQNSDRLHQSSPPPFPVAEREVLSAIALVGGDVDNSSIAHVILDTLHPSHRVEDWFNGANVAAWAKVQKEPAVQVLEYCAPKAAMYDRGPGLQMHR